MDVVSAFKGINDFHINHMANDVVLVGDAVTPMHIAAKAGDVECFASRVAFDKGDHLRGHFVFITQAANAEARLQAKRYFCLHFHELFLYQLIGGKRSAELQAVNYIVTGL